MNKFQQVVTELAAQHKLDLTAPVCHVRLSMPGYTDLVIEKRDPDHISVGHILDDGMPDPYFTLNMNREGDGDWYPTETRMLFFAGRIQPIRARAQLMDSIYFINDVWADNLRGQGWLTDATVANQLTAMTKHAWLLPADPKALITMLTPADGKSFGLKFLQYVVRGYIEQLPQWEPFAQGFSYIGNEEATLVSDPQPNWLATRLTGYDHYGMVIYGDVVFGPDAMLWGEEENEDA